MSLLYAIICHHQSLPYHIRSTHTFSRHWPFGHCTWGSLGWNALSPVTHLVKLYSCFETTRYLFSRAFLFLTNVAASPSLLFVYISARLLLFFLWLNECRHYFLSLLGFIIPSLMPPGKKTFTWHLSACRAAVGAGVSKWLKPVLLLWDFAISWEGLMHKPINTVLGGINVHMSMACLSNASIVSIPPWQISGQ